jgi:hypothetical protein
LKQGNARTRRPIKNEIPATALPSGVIGNVSPYPTVVIETNKEH